MCGQDWHRVLPALCLLEFRSTRWAIAARVTAPGGSRDIAGTWCACAVRPPTRASALCPRQPALPPPFIRHRHPQVSLHEKSPVWLCPAAAVPITTNQGAQATKTAFPHSSGDEQKSRCRQCWLCRRRWGGPVPGFSSFQGPQ